MTTEFRLSNRREHDGFLEFNVESVDAGGAVLASCPLKFSLLAIGVENGSSLAACSALLISAVNSLGRHGGE